MEVEIHNYVDEHNEIHPDYLWQIDNNEGIRDWIQPIYYKQGFLLRFYIPRQPSENYKMQMGIDSDYYDQDGYEEFNKTEKRFIDPITENRLTSHEAYCKYVLAKEYFKLYGNLCLYNMARIRQ